MSWYFLVDTYVDEQSGRGEYDEYIRLVKPIVEKYGGRYLVRTEDLTALSDKRTPNRAIVIKFNSREQLDKCFSSDEYKAIMSKRTNSADSRAVIAQGLCEQAMCYKDISKNATYPNLHPLRIPPNWTMELNKLEDIDPETLPPEDENWLFAFNEDILYMHSKISRKRNNQTEEQKLSIDLGWYPDGDPEGNFVLQAILNEDWLDPLLKFSSRNKGEIVKTLEKWLWEDFMPVRFIDGEYFHKKHKIYLKG